MTQSTSTSAKSTKVVFFLTKEEYHLLKTVLNFKNFKVVPGVGKEKGGLVFYAK